MSRSAISRLLATVGHLRVLSATLQEANAIESRVKAQIAAAPLLFDREAQALVVASATAMASQRRHARREAVAREIDAICAQLPGIAACAAAELSAASAAIRASETYDLPDRDIFGDRPAAKAAA